MHTRSTLLPASRQARRAIRAEIPGETAFRVSSSGLHLRVATASVRAMNALPKPSCLLIDLDGTLVDSATDIAVSANHVRKSMGMDPLPVDLVAKFVGDGVTPLMQRTLGPDAGVKIELEEDELRQAVKTFRAHYHDHCLEHSKLYAGVESTLKVLHPLPVAIVSNKPQAMCEKIAVGLGLTPWVVTVVGQRAGVPVKPDPSLLDLALGEMGLGEVAPESVWMVGDSRNDILSGRAIGATTVAVAYGLGDPDELRTHGPDLVVEEFREIADAVEAAR